MPESIVDAVSFTTTSATSFHSNRNPDNYGGVDPRWGFGGWSIAFGINVAAAGVGSDFNVYSATGNFFRPASTAQRVTATVTSLRETKSFVTRRVELAQGHVYACMTVDFAKPSTDALLTYSRKPRKLYASVSNSLAIDEQIKVAQQRGVSEKAIQRWHHRFGAKFRKFDQRAPRDSFMGHILTGLTEGWPDTEFDSLPMPEKSTCEYLRHQLPLTSHLEHVLAIAYLGDSYMPFTPFLFSKLPYTSIAAIGSLEFALRIFTNNLNLNEWHMAEEDTMVAAESRTYTESRMWDSNGRLVASMTQQGILKPARSKL